MYLEKKTYSKGTPISVSVAFSETPQARREWNDSQNIEEKVANQEYSIWQSYPSDMKKK